MRGRRRPDQLPAEVRTELELFLFDSNIKIVLNSSESDKNFIT